ncbi:MAG TPA: carboxypeptidase-like regulatory domain-containing protein [Thermoanaerobaculia bacterium]|nr:carboxypeptidase-like regulatory domain-containing protein [Thermoanaerobaculia bacterium]
MIATVAMGGAAEPRPSDLATFLPEDGVTGGCSAHVRGDDGKEEVFPCGESVRPPARGVVWLERGRSITPAQHALQQGEMRLPLVPAATLSIDAPPGLRIRLLHLGERGARTAFIRDVNPSAPVLMPAGRLLAVATDTGGRVAAVSRPVNAPANVETKQRLEAFPGEASVYAVLSGGDSTGLVPQVTSESLAKQADVLMRIPDALIAVWYAVDARTAELAAASETMMIVPQQLRLRPGSVTEVRAELRELPGITVEIAAESDAAREALKNGRLRLTAIDDETVLRELPVGGESRHRFDRIRPGIYTVVLALERWSYVRRAEVSVHGDASVAIAARPLEISGTVTRNGSPARANVALRSGRNLVAARTDEQGAYELHVWQAGRYQLEIAPDVEQMEPFIEMVRIRGDETLDFDFPDNEYTLRVSDSVTREPVAGASISVLTSWNDADGGERRTGRKVVVDERGLAALPPLFVGSIELHARADGYYDAEPRTVRIPAGAQGAPQLIDIALRPVSDGVTLTLLLPDGRPAAGAEVLLLRDTSGAVIWGDRADEAGVVRVPNSPGAAVVAVRHPNAASIVRAWQSGSDELRWPLPPSAPQPLVVKAESRTGEPLRNALVVAWIGDLRVSEQLLSFVTWSGSFTDRAGLWTARNLPAAPLRLLVVSNRADLSVAGTGGYDGSAEWIQHPWATPRLLRGIE